VLVGGNTGVYEGTIVRQGAVLAAGTILTRGTPVYDTVRGAILKATAETPLIIPAGAVVVPGSRAIPGGYGWQMGLSVYTPVIVSSTATRRRIYRPRSRICCADLWTPLLCRAGTRSTSLWQTRGRRARRRGKVTCPRPGA